MSRFYQLSLEDRSIENIFNTDDFVFSIAYCEKTNGIFYSKPNKNGISLLSLSDKTDTLYRANDISKPKSICLNKSHDSIFFEDNEYSISGFSLYGSVFSKVGSYTKMELNSFITSRTPFENETDFTYMYNCIDYIDDLKSMVISNHKKNIINIIDDSGKMKKIIGNGRKDFCLSTNPFNIFFNSPTGLCFLDDWQCLAVCDTNNHIIRCFSKKDKWKEVVTIGMPTKSGDSDSTFTKSSFASPTEICNFKKNIFVTDNSGKKIRKINMEEKSVETIHVTENFIKSITCSEKNIYWIEA